MKCMSACVVNRLFGNKAKAVNRILASMWLTKNTYRVLIELALVVFASATVRAGTCAFQGPFIDTSTSIAVSEIGPEISQVGLDALPSFYVQNKQSCNC